MTTIAEFLNYLAIELNGEVRSTTQGMAVTCTRAEIPIEARIKQIGESLISLGTWHRDFQFPIDDDIGIFSIGVYINNINVNLSRARLRWDSQRQIGVEYFAAFDEFLSVDTVGSIFKEGIGLLSTAGLGAIAVAHGADPTETSITRLIPNELEIRRPLVNDWDPEVELFEKHLVFNEIPFARIEGGVIFNSNDFIVEMKADKEARLYIYFYCDKYEITPTMHEYAFLYFSLANSGHSLSTLYLRDFSHFASRYCMHTSMESLKRDHLANYWLRMLRESTFHLRAIMGIAQGQDLMDALREANIAIRDA